MNYKSKIDKCFNKYKVIFERDPASLKRKDRYPFADLILKKEFKKKNIELDQIYKKVVLLNSLYSTNIFATFDVALKIFKIDNFYDRIKQGDISLIGDIRRHRISGQKKNFYSFATKYCHHHNPGSFPIYDSLVEKALLFFLNKEGAKKHVRKKMKGYKYFKSSMDELANIWQLPKTYKYEKLDKFLWEKGKKLKGKK
jgi:hypothetical protein